MSRYLNKDGLTYFTQKIKDGTIVAGKANQVPASGITGVIPIEHIPQDAQERLIKVANQAARFKLTINDVQLGDTVQDVDTGLMWFVIDTSKLNSTDGYQEYTAGKASSAAKADSVEWSGLQNKPNNIEIIEDYQPLADNKFDTLKYVLETSYTDIYDNGVDGSDGSNDFGNVITFIDDATGHKGISKGRTIRSSHGWMVSGLKFFETNKTYNASKDNQGVITIGLSDFLPDVTGKKPSEINSSFGYYREDTARIPNALVITNIVTGTQDEPISQSQILLSSRGEIMNRTKLLNQDAWGEWEDYAESLTNTEIDEAIAAAK